MQRKELRFTKIRECMRLLDENVTISEIHEWISKCTQVKVSRKTIQRDLEELIERRIVIQAEGCPLRFRLLATKIYCFKLGLDDVDQLLESISHNSKIKNLILKQLHEE